MSGSRKRIDPLIDPLIERVRDKFAAKQQKQVDTRYLEYNCDDMPSLLPMESAVADYIVDRSNYPEKLLLNWNIFNIHTSASVGVIGADWLGPTWENIREYLMDQHNKLARNYKDRPDVIKEILWPRVLHTFQKRLEEFQTHWNSIHPIVQLRLSPTHHHETGVSSFGTFYMERVN